MTLWCVGIALYLAIGLVAAPYHAAKCFVSGSLAKSIAAGIVFHALWPALMIVTILAIRNRGGWI